jgi:hypothetical protein
MRAVRANTAAIMRSTMPVVPLMTSRKYIATMATAMIILVILSAVLTFDFIIEFFVLQICKAVVRYIVT